MFALKQIKDNDDFVHPKHVSTGAKLLDEFLGGGIPLKGITEICGESSSGKTQFGLQLALRAQLPVNHGGLGKGIF